MRSHASRKRIGLYDNAQPHTLYSCVIGIQLARLLATRNILSFWVYVSAKTRVDISIQWDICIVTWIPLSIDIKMN